jgi:hypothetical protein
MLGEALGCWGRWIQALQPSNAHDTIEMGTLADTTAASFLPVLQDEVQIVPVLYVPLNGFLPKQTTKANTRLLVSHPPPFAYRAGRESPAIRNTMTGVARVNPRRAEGQLG